MTWLLNMQRITIPEIKNHPWFRKNLPRDLGFASSNTYDDILQSEEDIMKIVNEAKVPSLPKLSDPYEFEDVEFDMGEGSGGFIMQEYGIEDYADDRLNF